MSTPRAPERLAYLDAFRGFAIAAMVLVNNPGSWSHVHAPLAHAPWHGCTPTDLIFPFFLFASGLSLTFSLDRAPGGGSDPARRYGRLLRRAGTLALVGVLLNLLPTLDLATLRIPGVLQRIALCLALAAPLVLWGGARGPWVGILVAFGLWLGITFGVPVRGADGLVAAGRLEPGQDPGAWLDRWVFGRHLWAKAGTWDPEGLLGTLPATANVWMGVIAGRFLAGPGDPRRKTRRLVGAGIALLVVGLAGSRVLPLNKSLWTPTFVLVTGGWSLLALAACHGLLEGASEARRDRARGIFRPLLIFGLNPLFLFVASGLLGRAVEALHPGGAGSPSLKAVLFHALASGPLAPRDASLVYALGFELIIFALAWGLWRKRWVITV